MDKEIILLYTRSILHKINTELRSYCNGSLQVHLYKPEELSESLNTYSIYDPEHSTYDFIICLIYTNDSQTNCVSSISCKINDDNSLEFSSMTDPLFEKKRYNLLLRSVLIMVCRHIHIRRQPNIYDRITMIVSRAINPVSIYLLSKYFNAYNDELHNFMEEKNITHKDLTLDLAKEFYESRDSNMEIDDEEEAARYFKKDPDFGSPVIMTIDLSDIELANKVFLTTVKTIGCPPTQRGGKKTKRAGKKRQFKSRRKIKGEKQQKSKRK